ncbi:asparagine N-glycosylation enzyme membrane subunit Stt3 [Nocardiopsis mwathae]|uniref:Asparagine N-glycosylation enzyme membrane subunit Stt3 n=1 Tax=Nocardiopsis mwathae TaxID=1472723 RepID=A0A7W9YJ34_9ACTN|nr:hypothetical protein [Nocardiopsis mwathae]MBB6172890.1 asparagine N-glycosylation enzyme membrane subunit Stt3 [Nocardiopsis mwathae]
MSSDPTEKRFRGTDALIAGVVLAIELFDAYGSLGGDPLDPVAGWNTAQNTDPWAFVLVLLGCGALYWRRTHPVTTLAVATAAFSVFLLRDFELGMFLAPMVAFYTVAALGRERFPALLAGTVCMSATVGWLYTRTSEITDAGVGVLAWVAFGSVILIFFAGSYVAGELVRCHRLLSSYRDAGTASELTRLETDGRATQEAAQVERGGDA